MTTLLPVLALAGALSRFQLRAQIVRKHFLQVQIVATSSEPILVPPLARFGCEVQVEVQDESGVLLGHVGPRAQCERESADDFQVQVSLPGSGSSLFGTEVDLSVPHRFRIGPNEDDLELGRQYRLVVSFETGGEMALDTEARKELRRRHPGLAAPALRLEAKPIPFSK